LQQGYQALVNQVATDTSAAKQNATATQAVQNTLQTQQASVSGVNLDEEASNLMQQQRSFQAAAQLITAVNAMMTTLIAMVT
jgi:flagellar hook-associated protein 1 FlgK